MADPVVTSLAPKKRRGWLRALAWVFGILILLLVLIYFVGTSSAFFKGVILPKVSAALNANVTVSDASISPFHKVVLRDLKVVTTGRDPLVSAPEVALRYSLLDIVKGNIHVEEVVVSSPTIVVVQNPDGTSNLDPLLKAQKAAAPQAKPSKPAPSAKPSKPMQLDIGKATITEATFRSVKLYADGKQDVAEISHLKFDLENVKNGQAGKLSLSAQINANNNPPSPQPSGTLQAQLDGGFDFALTPDLAPANAKGSMGMKVNRADGLYAQATAFGGILDCDVTATEIKQVALHFQKGDMRLGELRISGPFDMQKSEGNLKVELLNLDKNLLNLAGAATGMDFESTTVSSTNQIQIAKAGSMITTVGQFNLDHFQVTRTNQTTPPLDLHANYNLVVDQAASNLVFHTLTLAGTEKGNRFLEGELTSPMQIAWGGQNGNIGDASLNVAVTGFDLGDWKAFLGDNAPAGIVNAHLKLTSQQTGKLLTFDADSQITSLAAGAGSNRITDASLALQASGKATNMKQFELGASKLELARQNQTLLSASAKGTFDQASQNADLQMDGQLMLASLLQALPRSDIKVTSGSAQLKAHITQSAQSSSTTTNAQQTVTGNFALVDFNGQVGSNDFQHFGATADMDISMTPQEVQIRKLTGRITQGQTQGGSFDVSGTCELATMATHLTARLSEFNQDGLAPFLQAMLGDKKLVSVAVNANASVQYDPQAASAIKADLQVTNLVVHDPKQQVPATPLAASFQLDTSLNKQAADIRQFQLALTPTPRGTNVVQVSGHIDMSQTNATQGNLKLTADSLDLTAYYDLFGGQQTAAARKPASGGSSTAPAAPQATPSPEQEPEAKQFPVRNFVADATIHRIYLHEVEIDDWQTTVKVDGGHIVVNPCKLTLNGAPVTALVDADLGVPGFKYSLSFNAQAVPLAPLVNTFQPDQKGVLSGTATAQTKIDGAGITGANLQKNLSGQYDLSSTNLNLSTAKVRNKYLRPVLDVITQIPELVQNPLGKGASLLGGLTGAGKTSTNDLARSPIESIIARGDMGAGKINLQQTLIQSPAFEAGATGTVTLASILTNSTLEIPVSVALARPVAQALYLAPTNSPSNVPYVALPDFVSETGTLGKPEVKYDKLVLAKTAAQVATSALGTRGGAAGQLLQGILGGGKTSSTNASGGNTNQPGGGLGGLLHGLEGGLKGNSSATSNAPNSSTNQSPANSLLRGLFGPGK